MAYARRHTLILTTAAGGAVIGFTPVINGPIFAVIYVKDDFADTVDFAITGEETGQNIWTEANVTAAKTVAPRQPTHSQAGVASLYAAVGEPVEGLIHIANERVKVSVTAGGDTKSGTFHVITG